MTDRFITVKNQCDLPDSIKPFVSFQLTDNNIEAIVIKVADDSIRIVKGGAYSDTLKVLTKQPLKSVTKYRLSGKYIGLTDVNEVFDNKYNAETRLNEFSAKAGYDETGLTVEEFVEFVVDTSL